MEYTQQGNTYVPIGKRIFTGNFDALLNHNDKSVEAVHEKRMAKKQLRAYLAGHQRYTVRRGVDGLPVYNVTPQKFI